MSLNVLFSCSTLVASEQGRSDIATPYSPERGKARPRQCPKKQVLSLLLSCPSMPRETLTGARTGGRDSPICRRRRSVSRCPGLFFEKDGDTMFCFPDWMLIVVPRLWSFCKVPIPCTFEGSTNRYKMQRLKRWYPTGYK